MARPSALARWLPVAVLVPVAVIAAHNLAQEWRVYAAAHPIAAPVGTPAIAPFDARMPARAALDTALALARGALEQPVAMDRARTIDQARAYLRLARSARANWADADSVDTFIAFAANGAQSPETLAAYARSYRTAPYMEASATWRIRYGMAMFSALDGDTRQAMLNEAAWVSTWSHRHYALVTSIAGPTLSAPLRAARRAYNRTVHIE